MQSNLKLSNFMLKSKRKCSGSKNNSEKNVFKKEIYFILSETRFDRKQRKNNVCGLFCD